MADTLENGTPSTPKDGNYEESSFTEFPKIWNKHVDIIPVNKNIVIEPGYAYIFDGENFYKSRENGDFRFIGFDTDTYNSEIEIGEGNVIRIPVAGFFLAYVDDEYRPGTALMCGPGGILTKVNESIFKSDPRVFIATYWERERHEQISDGTRTVNVNGRHWVKVR